MTWIAFGQIAHHPFLGLDDDLTLQSNPWVKGGLRAAGVRWAFTTLETGNWHPLTWLSHMTVVEFFGLDPGVHHALNLLLHSITAVLLFVTLGALTGSPVRSALVACLFAIHPLHVESVAWISERKDLLSGLFCVLAIAAYARYVRRPRTAAYLPIAAFFALALTAKPMAVTLPFVLLLLDFWPLGRLRSHRTAGADSEPFPLLRLVVEKAPLFTLAAGSSVVAFIAQAGKNTLSSLEILPLPTRLMHAVPSYAWYLCKSIWPSSLSVYYPHPGSAIEPWSAVLSASLLLIISWFALRYSRDIPAAATGWLWFCGMLVPVIGIVQIGAQSRADRYSYLPSLGIGIACVWIIADLRSRLRLPVFWPVSAALAVIAICTGMAKVQVGYWKDGETLFRHTISLTDGNWLIHNNLGAELLRKGRVGEAGQHFREALRLHPSYQPARLNLGLALASQGNTVEAKIIFREIIRDAPEDGKAHYELGRLLAGEQALDAAIFEFTTAIRLQPDLAAAQESLGKVLSIRGALREAYLAYEQAVRLRPDRVSARIGIGWLLMKMKRSADAIGQFREAATIQPSSIEALNGLGAALAESGRPFDAIAHFEAALRLDPDNAAIRKNLDHVREGMKR